MLCIKNLFYLSDYMMNGIHHEHNSLLLLTIKFLVNLPEYHEDLDYKQIFNMTETNKLLIYNKQTVIRL